MAERTSSSSSQNERRACIGPITITAKKPERSWTVRASSFTGQITLPDEVVHSGLPRKYRRRLTPPTRALLYGVMVAQRVCRKTGASSRDAWGLVSACPSWVSLTRPDDPYIANIRRNTQPGPKKKTDAYSLLELLSLRSTTAYDVPILST